MDWTSLETFLKSATTFDLLQVRSLVSELLEDPERIASVRRRIHPGLAITYWQPSTRSLVEATIIEIRRSMALVKEHESGELWNIPLTWINVEGRPAAPVHGTTPARQWKVGDSVSFPDRQNCEIVGEIVKLNPKRAEIRTSQGIWMVHYQYLTHIVDAEATVRPAVLRLPSNNDG